MRGDTTAEVLRGLKPAFKKDGSVTAGNAPPVNDGAAALVVMAEDKMKAAQRQADGAHRRAGDERPGAEDAADDAGRSHAQGVEEGRLVDRTTSTCSSSTKRSRCRRWRSATSSASIMSKVNVNGGAVALGHPIGASGARILTTLIYALKDRGLKRGIATLCLGGGNGVALAIELHMTIANDGPRIRISLATAHSVVRNEVVEPVAPRDRLEDKRVREIDTRSRAATAPSRRAAACVGAQPVEQHVRDPRERDRDRQARDCASTPSTARPATIGGAEAVRFQVVPAPRENRDRAHGCRATSAARHAEAAKARSPGAGASSHDGSSEGMTDRDWARSHRTQFLAAPVKPNRPQNLRSWPERGESGQFP